MRDDHLEDTPVTSSEDGYFQEADPREPVSCDPEQEECATDDDPDSVAIHPPGTPDDVPYSLGEESSEPEDQHIGPGGPLPDVERDELDPGVREERDLWRHQRALVEEDEAAGYNVAGFDDEEIERIKNALGDDAAEVDPETPGGTSATGSVSGAEHGGFPERNE